MSELPLPHAFDARPLICGFELKRPSEYPTVEVYDGEADLIVDFGPSILTRDLGPFKAGEEFEVQLDYAAGKYIFWQDDFDREVMQYPALAILHPVKGSDQLESARRSEIRRLSALQAKHPRFKWTLELLGKWGSLESGAR